MTTASGRFSKASAIADALIGRRPRRLPRQLLYTPSPGHRGFRDPTCPVPTPLSHCVGLPSPLTQDLMSAGWWPHGVAIGLRVDPHIGALVRLRSFETALIARRSSSLRVPTMLEAIERPKPSAEPSSGQGTARTDLDAEIHPNASRPREEPVDSSRALILSAPCFDVVRRSAATSRVPPCDDSLSERSPGSLIRLA